MVASLELEANRKLDTPFVGMQSSGLSLFHRLYKEIKKVCAVHRQLLDIVCIQRWHCHNIRSVVEFAKRNPYLAPFSSNLGYCLANAYSMKQFCSIDADANTGANLLVLWGLFVDIYFDQIPAVMVEG